METLTSETNNFVALRSDIETRLFLLRCVPNVPVNYSEHKFELRATWDGLTRSEAKRIERVISYLRTEILQTKFN
jgi:hypothetical protein